MPIQTLSRNVCTNLFIGDADIGLTVRKDWQKDLERHGARDTGLERSE